MLTLLIAFGLKYHYSRAGSADLEWILRPTARLVEIMSGLNFEKEKATGYINREQYVVIAPACAGVNFLITAFCMAMFSFLHQVKCLKAKLAWLSWSLGSAYLITLFVNALRILLAITLYQADFYSGWLTAERLHRLAGIVVYFFFLCLYHVILQKIRSYFPDHIPLPSTNSGHRLEEPVLSMSKEVRGELKRLRPLFWYLSITIVVPLLTRSYQDNLPHFLEHSGFVLTGCIAVLLSVFVIQAGWKHLTSKK